jgi:hypothetical protein
MRKEVSDETTSREHLQIQRNSIGMVRIVLLAVGAAWAAVIIPPLLRSRVDNRPNSSVNDFRRQLSTLQRAVPARGMTPMRAMGRPLAQAPQRAHTTAIQRPRQGRQTELRSHTGGIERRPEQRDRDDRGRSSHRQVHMHRVSQREVVRRRRANVLVVLGVVTAATLFLAATTKSNVMLYAFALSFVSTCFYCYRLGQLRSFEQGRHYGDTWFNAA